MGYADQIRCNFPLPTKDSIKSAVATGAHVGESLAQGKVAGISDENETREGRATENAQAETEKLEESGPKEVLQAKGEGDADPHLRSSTAHQSAYDSGMSWGRAGQTETSHERGAETIPESALQAAGINPGLVGTSVSPIPEVLPGPAGFEPAPSRTSSTYNAAAIFENTRIG